MNPSCGTCRRIGRTCHHHGGTPLRRCAATSGSTGEQCIRSAAPDAVFCNMHRAAGGKLRELLEENGTLRARIAVLERENARLRATGAREART